MVGVGVTVEEEGEVEIVGEEVEVGVEEPWISPSDQVTIEVAEEA